MLLFAATTEEERKQEIPSSGAACLINKNRHTDLCLHRKTERKRGDGNRGQRRGQRQRERREGRDKRKE